MNIENIKKSVKELYLDDKYYDILRHNSEELQRKYPDKGYFTDDGHWIDIYDPNAYKEILYIVYKEGKIYLGNEQIPNEPGLDNKKRTANMIEYWFRGNNCFFTILHEFVGVHNKSISEKGCGCNQAILNIIKAEVIETIKTNLNVQNVEEIDADELKSQYGKIISKYKTKTRTLLKNTSVEEFSKTFVNIIDDISMNKKRWANFLYEKNRFSLISEYQEDIDYTMYFLSTFGRVDELYIAILIIMKEYLLWHLSEWLSNKNNFYKTVFSKREYILNPKCTVNELYDWKRMFDNSKPVDIVLAICYKNVFEAKVVADKRDYKAFRNNLYKQIYLTKNNDK